jgi:hypothetical protein
MESRAAPRRLGVSDATRRRSREPHNHAGDAQRRSGADEGDHAIDSNAHW